MPTIEVSNLGEVLSSLNRVRLGLNDADVAGVLMDEAGRPLRDELRQAAPKGPTGNLRKAIKARKAKDRARMPAVYVLVDRRTAPHLHFVTGGTAPRFPKARKALKVMLGGLLGGDFIFRRRAAKTRPNPYFAETFSRMQTEVLDRVGKAVGKLIDKAAR